MFAADDHALIVIDEQAAQVYSGSEFAKLAGLGPDIGGHVEILGAFRPDERERAAAALDRLRADGVLVEGSGGPSAGDGWAWWASQRVAPEIVAARTGERSLQVVALGGVEPGPVVAALARTGISVAREGEAGDLVLVLVDDYLDPNLAELNARALEDGRPWMLAQPEQAELRVGPVFVPDEGSCWECLAQRLRLRRELIDSLRVRFGGDRPAPRVAAPDVLRGVGSALVTSELVAWMTGARPGLKNLVRTFDARTWEGTTNHVVWRPQCPACGEGGASEATSAQPIRLRAAAGARSASLRSVPLRVTLERFEHHLSPLTGVVGPLTRVWGPDQLHVYICDAGVPRIHGDDSEWGELMECASGKGTTDEAARASALCEGLERYSGEFAGDEPRRSGTLEKLADIAIHPNDVMGFSPDQYRDRLSWNEAAMTGRTSVPEPFDERDEIEWTPVWSLTRDRERLLPTAMCYYRAAVAGRQYTGGADSNGAAAGSTLEEAILYGLLELIERDQVAVWWYNGLTAPGINLDSLEEDWLRDARAHVAATGQELWALDLTADLGVPVVVAILTVPSKGAITIGCGAHLDLARATIRAVTEVFQLGLGGPSGGLGRGVHKNLTLDEHPFVRPDPDLPPRTCHQRFTGTVSDGLTMCRQAVEAQNIEILVLDQTRPDVGLPVVKLFAPGLRHFWPRFAQGRLYDVPVKLGLLSEPRREDELTQEFPVV